jgi:hypothetical protein
MSTDPGAIGRRLLPAGFPDDLPRPPVYAESGDPFSSLRVIEAIAQVDRGRPVRIDAIVDRLNATHLDWLFTRRVVIDVLVVLQSNWMADYRNVEGVVVADGPLGATIAIEDSSRVDPWIVRQAIREAAACRRILLDFSQRERVAGE